LAYGYAFTGDFPRAIALMQRYVALQPGQPNPHDSYGEILRMAGNFDEALDQYRQSIRIDPNFGSELGVADTLALMGKEEEARDEYARAEVFAADQALRIQYKLSSAVTWIREDNRKQAERSIREVARYAHSAGLAQLEAEAHRVLAMYEPDYKNACKELDAAQKALDEPHQITPVERDEEHARILMVRAVRASQAHLDSATFADELEAMASNSRSEIIQSAFHTAAGAQLIAHANYTDAISHLQENSDDPIALRLLWQAFTNAGKAEQAETIAAKLASVNVPSPEQALVVPQFRTQRLSEAKHP
jgi:tetratricopeptide (TPR) repeat protein